MAKKRIQKKVKEIELPMRFNVGLQKYEPILPKGNNKQTKTKKVKTSKKKSSSLWIIILLILILLILTSNWLITWI